jgi:hypothetical protein
MARKLRIEYEGARYHVINRGNYRRDIFETEGAKEAFEETLLEASELNGQESGLGEVRGILDRIGRGRGGAA